MGHIWGPPGFCRPQVGPMILAIWADFLSIRPSRRNFRECWPIPPPLHGITASRPQWVTSLAPGPGRFEQNLRLVIFKLTSVTDGWGISCKIALRWMPPDLTDDKSTLVQVMAWCRQATSHYLSQCWPRSLSPYGINRSQWVNTLTHWGRDKMDAILQTTFSSAFPSTKTFEEIFTEICSLGSN